MVKFEILILLLLFFVLRESKRQILYTYVDKWLTILKNKYCYSSKGFYSLITTPVPFTYPSSYEQCIGDSKKCRQLNNTNILYTYCYLNLTAESGNVINLSNTRIIKLYFVNISTIIKLPCITHFVKEHRLQQYCGRYMQFAGNSKTESEI